MQVVSQLTLTFNKNFKYYLVSLGIITSFYIFYIPFSIKVLEDLRRYSSKTLFFTIYINIGSISFFLLVYYLIYHFEIFKNYKECILPWPWERRKDYWDKLLGVSAIYLFINEVIIPIILKYIIAFFYFDSIDTQIQEIPTRNELLVQMIICLIVSELFSYISHRLMHTKYLYRMLHKTQHDYLTNISLTTFHMHPIDFIISFIIPAIIGPIILVKYYKLHEISLWCWIIIINGFKIDSYCGYNIPFSPFRILPMYSSLNNTKHFVIRSRNFTGFFVRNKKVEKDD